MGTVFLLEVMKIFWNDSSESWRTLGIHQNPQNCILLMGEFYGM